MAQPLIFNSKIMFNNSIKLGGMNAFMDDIYIIFLFIYTDSNFTSYVLTLDEA